MFRFAIFVCLCCSAISVPTGLPKHPVSYSGEYGGSGGQCFSHAVNQLNGPITALKIWADSSYINGLQVQYGNQWSHYVGGSRGEFQEVVLHPGEGIVQVSGKADHYIRKLEFQTNFGRHFCLGFDYGSSFSDHPLFPNTTLSYFGGRAGAVIDAISFYWNVKAAQG